MKTFSRVNWAPFVLTLDLVFGWTLLSWVVFPLLLVSETLSPELFEILTRFLFGFWLSLIAWTVEKVNETKVTFSGDRIFPLKRVVIVCNHRTELDWMFLWNFAIRQGRLGDMKYFLKCSLQNVPLVGWAFHIMRFIPLHRKWGIDEKVIKSCVSSFKDSQRPLWLVIFPEGTDFSWRKWERSQDFAIAHNLPRFQHTLLPRSRGFLTAVSELRSSLDAVYDITVAYHGKAPTFLDVILGSEPKEVHMHLRRISVCDVPSSDEDTKAWMLSLFKRKDELLDSFSKQGSFPGVHQELELSFWEGLLNQAIAASVVMGAVLMAVNWPIWVCLYMICSNLFLIAITYFGWLPSRLKCSSSDTNKIGPLQTQQID